MACNNSTVVDADIDVTWSTLRNFHQMGWAKGVIESVDVVGEKPGTEPGAGRALNGVFHETLISFDNERRTFSYSIDDGPGPVARDQISDYVGTVPLKPVTDTGQTFVEWRSNYDSADPAAVGAFCDPIYRALLAALKAHLG